MKKIFNLKNSIVMLLNPLTFILFPFVRKDYHSFFSDTEAVDLLIKKRMSMSRFGDGEFGIMFRKQGIGFQKYSSNLAKELKRVINENNSNLLIGLPFVDKYNEWTDSSKKFYRYFRIFKGRYSKLIRYDKKYSNACITRPYMDFKDKRPNNIEPKFDNLKRLWNKRNIVIVEGKDTKIGVGNDLLDNAKSIKRIICPSSDAYSKIKEIQNEILKQSKNNLFLVSLGPTATILASNLSKMGYQVIDTGHIDVEYMWYKIGAKSVVKLKGKYVNEAGGILNDVIPDEKKYKESIISIIK